MRTYYAVEFGTPTYPVNELVIQARPFNDPGARAHTHAVRASSTAEADQLIRDRLNGEREAEMRAQFASS